MEQEDLKRAIKEAIKEWLDERFVQFGKWSLTGLVSVLIAALLYFILWANGYHK